MTLGPVIIPARFSHLLRITLSPRAARLLAGAVLLVCAVFAAHALFAALRGVRGEYLAFSDFFAQWSFAWFARMNDVARIYNANVLHQFQLTLEPALRQSFPFPYPPTYLLTIWPLSWLSYGPAYLVWDIATLALFLWGVLGAKPRMPMLAFVLLAPVTVITLQQGQNGLLSAALIVGGLRLMGARPVIAGILLGLATFKPQLGVLVPLALIGAGAWRTIAAASITALLLILATGLVFGWAVWPAWFDAASGHGVWLEQSVSNYLKPSIMANLELAGASRWLAHAVQAGVAAVVAVLVVLCFWRGATDLSLAALQVGTFLAMPWFFRYDMPMLANAILFLVRDRERSARNFGLIETGIILAGLLFPVVVTLTSRFFYVSSLSLLLLFGLIVWRRLGPEGRRRHSMIASC